MQGEGRGYVVRLRQICCVSEKNMLILDVSLDIFQKKKNV